MASNALQMYEDAARTATSSRELEANALFKAARQLEACQLAWQSENGQPRLAEALRYNQRLWTFFQAELERPDHHLDVTLRQNLLGISGFVDRRTFELLARPEPDKVQALIDINRNVAAGLSTRVGSETTDPDGSTSPPRAA